MLSDLSFNRAGLCVKDMDSKELMWNPKYNTPDLGAVFMKDRLGSYKLKTSCPIIQLLKTSQTFTAWQDLNINPELFHQVAAKFLHLFY